VIKIEYLEEKRINGTGTKAQLNRERIKQSTGEKIKKINRALSANTICFSKSFPLSKIV
tara:strand:+ start:185 stop:361 length:177 start_codon:yes stop_codon:yes gene_type:complete